MFNFIKECYSKYKIANGYQNVQATLPNIKMTVFEGVQSIANFKGRECELRAVFNSYSLDYKEAYNQLDTLKENLMVNDWEHFKNLGFEIDNVNFESIKDLSFTQNLEKVFRYEWTVKVTYWKVV
ncbi:MAG: hypothetical protein ACRC6E_05465 [Fusobacteriaceae bacterium]